MLLKVIVDVDTGVDDAAALLLLLSRDDVEVLAITCVNGNVDVDKICINTLRVLKVCGRTNIPVYRGAEKALLDCKLDASHFHGKDGLGDTTWSDSEAVDISDIKSEHAVMAIIRLTRQYPGEITLIPLGPLTNIALALQLEPNLGKHIKEVFIMGGNSEARGNVTISSEFNFHIDPEAAFLCLSSFHIPLNIIPWEVCLQACLSWKQYDDWTELETAKAKFFRKISKRLVEIVLQRRSSGFRSCDLFTMVTVLDRSSILETETVFATIELNGQWTRGQMVIDWSNKLNNDAKVTIIKKICKDKIISLFSKALKKL